MITINRKQIEDAKDFLTTLQYIAATQGKQKDVLTLGAIIQILEDKLHPRAAADEGDYIMRNGKWEGTPLYRCPCCGFGELAKGEDCQECGQVIDWEEDDEK